MRTAALLTAEDFGRVAPVLGPCELVKGEIVPMSPGGIRHSQVTGQAYFLLKSHAQAQDLGRVLTGEAGVVVSRRPDTVRGAEVAFISYRRLPRGVTDHGFLVLLHDTDTVSADPHVPGFTVRVRQFFED